MHNCVMQVFWLEMDAAGEDTPGADWWELRDGGDMWLRWNTFTLHGNSINMLRVFVWVVAMREKCELSQ